MSSIHFNDMYTVGIFAAVAALGGTLAGTKRRNELLKGMGGWEHKFDWRYEVEYHNGEWRASSSNPKRKPYVSKIDQMPAKTVRQWARWGVAAGVAFVFARSLFSYN